MDQDLSKIVQDLTVQESKLQAELDDANGKVKSFAERLGQVQTAIAALRGAAHQKTVKSGVRPAQKSATQAEIEGIVSELTNQYGTSDFSEILQHVKARLLSQGYSRLGVKAMVSKAVSSQRSRLNDSQLMTV